MRSGFVAALLLVGVAAAQAREPAQAPVEVGRTFALGGTCRKILVAADQRHALTVGSHGDLCWWDLERREVVRYVEPRAHYVTAATLHPTRPLAAVCWTEGSHGDDAPVSAVDLETGTVTQWLPGRFDALQFDPSGRQLAVQRPYDETTVRELLQFDVDALPTTDLDVATQRQRDAKFHDGLRFVDGRVEGDATATYAQPTMTRSADGAHEAAIVKSRKSNGGLRLDGKTFEPPCHETLLAHLRVTDAGLAIAADVQGQLHFVTAEGAMQLRAPHRGDVFDLVFSPDGRHLAVHGLGAVRIVALDGAEELRLDGSHIVVAGEAGAEFRIFSPHRCWSFEAQSRREVGEAVTWQEPAMRMLRTAACLGWSSMLRGRSWSAWQTGVAAMVDGAPWLADNHFPYHLQHWNGAAFTPAVPVSSLQPLKLVAPPGQDELLYVCGRNNLDDESYSLRIHLIDHHGAPLATWNVESPADWLVVDARRERLWISTYGEVTCLSLTDLGEIQRNKHQRAWYAADLLPEGSRFGGALLASDGAGLMVVDPDTFEERHRWPNPDGWQSIDVLAVAPDGRHVAIAHRDDVRILRLP